MSPLLAEAARTAPVVDVPPWWGVALSLLLVVLAVVLSRREGLGLGRELLVAAARAGVQLVAVGAALRVLFLHAGLPGSLGWVSGMVLLAGRTAGRRARGLPQAERIATIGVGIAALVSVGLLVGAGVVEDRPEVVVPIGGMVVSASMQGAALALSRIRDEVLSSRALVEARLALGLPGRRAFAPHLRTALRGAILPNVDQTKVVGLITLPGSMTGLIIAGVPPLLAIRYQIVVMYMFLGATSVAATVCGRLAVRAVFDDAQRLRPISPGPTSRRRRPWEAKGVQQDGAHEHSR